jgi:hypothetical protein
MIRPLPITAARSQPLRRARPAGRPAGLTAALAASTVTAAAIALAAAVLPAQAGTLPARTGGPEVTVNAAIAAGASGLATRPQGWGP